MIILLVSVFSSVIYQTLTHSFILTYVMPGLDESIFIHPFLLSPFVEHLLCAKHRARHWDFQEPGAAPTCSNGRSESKMSSSNPSPKWEKKSVSFMVLKSMFWSFVRKNSPWTFWQTSSTRFKTKLLVPSQPHLYSQISHLILCSRWQG